MRDSVLKATYQASQFRELSFSQCRLWLFGTLFPDINGRNAVNIAFLSGRNGAVRLLFEINASELKFPFLERSKGKPLFQFFHFPLIELVAATNPIIYMSSKYTWMKF
ncbi:unnamed protein product [Durusdinium trenchii]|uniref:LAGLIDADG homing endonuclease n=1 Tax=Durusdinium trenchii TaxID=1381693 RepID=A0ABP0L4Z7_9DINO